MRFLIVLVALLGAACGHGTYADFQPQSAQDAKEAPRVVLRARAGYPGDIDALNANGALVGWIRAYNLDAAALEAARRGATHVVLVDRQQPHTYRISTGSETSITLQNARYATFRVEPEKWAFLADILRPMALPDRVGPDCECRLIKQSDTWARAGWNLVCPGERPKLEIGCE